LSAIASARGIGLATFLFFAGPLGFQQVHAEGDTRTISLHHVHTNENLTITYKKNGQYDEEALKKINWIMRDWRKNEPVKMDPQGLDLLWEVYHEVGAKEPINIICGYRSPATNSMLRSRSKGVARNSQHTLGKAIDFFIPGVPLEKLRAAAMKAQGGGVGYYPTSGSPFVHLDVGGVRAWPRMTREQLVKLFPDGRTVHLPSDGNPLPGYQQALADIERGQRTAASPKKRSLLASLFGRDKDAEEVEDNSAVRETAVAAKRGVTAKSTAAASTAAASTAAAQARTVVAAAQEPATETTPVPLPPKRPIYQVASADSRPAAPFAPRGVAPINLASLSPTDIINMRGLWDHALATASGSESLEMSSARRALASSLTASMRDTTASIGSDRVPSEVALAYAAQTPVDAGSSTAPAVMATDGRASIVSKTPVNISQNRVSQANARLEDPWLRGLMLTSSVQNSLVVSRVGELDLMGLVEHMQKPDSAVMMTFSGDPYLGMTTDTFSGSAVVFQATVTFQDNKRRTAALR
jgi:uncharacterized protein YcbK (DUF882 family)